MTMAPIPAHPMPFEELTAGDPVAWPRCGPCTALGCGEDQNLATKNDVLDLACSVCGRDLWCGCCGGHLSQHMHLFNNRRVTTARG